MITVVCYTLFDITQTGVRNRSKPPEDQEYDIWVNKRNTQCNFDTVQQAISLRSQPEILSLPKKIDIRFDTFDNFGFLYQQIENETYPCWTFEFAVHHASVFNDGISDLGTLYSDCHKIPMVHCNTQWEKLPSFLDGSDELRNIYFEVRK